MKYEQIEKRAVGLASILICVFLGVFAFYLFLKFGLPILLPFIIGWLLAAFILPVAKRLSGKNEKRRRFISVFILLLFLAAAGFILSLGLRRLLYEAERLAHRLSSDSEELRVLIYTALDFAESITEHIPFLDRLTGSEELLGLREKIDSTVSTLLSGLVSELSTRLPGWIGALVGAIPGLMLFLLITLISAFYFCIDLDNIYSGIRAFVSCETAAKLSRLKKRAGGTALKYLRAYFLLFLLTFGELFVGFTVLRIDYAFILAILTSVIDILPVFGVGSVLIPWSAVLLISGNYYNGIGLLIIYAFVTVVRQIAEPKIVGGSIGLHPLLTLASIYAGFKLLGVIGMLLGPVIALAIKGTISHDS